MSRFYIALWFGRVARLSVYSLFVALFFSFFAPDDGLFGWFDIYALYGFILLGGYISFVIMSFKCKRVKIVTC